MYRPPGVFDSINWDCRGVGNCVGVENWEAEGNGWVSWDPGGGGSALLDPLWCLDGVVPPPLPLICDWLPFVDPGFPPLIPLAMLDSGPPKLELLTLRCRRITPSCLNSPSRRTSNSLWSRRRMYSAIASASRSLMRDATLDSIVPSLVEAEPLRKRLCSTGSKGVSRRWISQLKPKPMDMTHQKNA